MNRPSIDRLAELETLRPDEDCPADARLSVTASDLRDLVALIPIVRECDKAKLWEEGYGAGFRDGQHAEPDGYLRNETSNPYEEVSNG
jgi:hypothetical protein